MADLGRQLGSPSTPALPDGGGFIQPGSFGNAGPGDIFVNSPGYKQIRSHDGRPQTWTSGMVEVSTGAPGFNMKGTLLESTAGSPGGGLTPAFYQSGVMERTRKTGVGEVRFLSMAEVEALLRAVPDDGLGRVERVLYLAAATSGMRQGELIALRWRDIDWPAKRIRVRRSYVRGEFGTPKSKRSSRAVPLIDRLAGELDRLSAVSAFDADDDLVFAHPATGSPLDRSKVLKRFKAAMRAAGMGHRLGEGRITFHSLRHSFGTAMAAQGAPMRTLQELMGHRDFATTLIYADYSPSAHEAEWAEAAFAPPGTVSGTELSETDSTQPDLKPPS